MIDQLYRDVLTTFQAIIIAAIILPFLIIAAGLIAQLMRTRGESRAKSSNVISIDAADEKKRAANKLGTPSQ